MSPIRIVTGNAFFTSCFLASLLALFWKFRYRALKISWTPVVIPLVWPIAAKFVLGASAMMLPITFDRYLYAADGGFGFQPAFAGAQLLLANPWLWHTSEFCYANLPVAIMLLYLLLRSNCGEEQANAFVRLAGALAIAGFALYFVCPAVGPAGAFPADFPNQPPVVSVIPSAMPLIERNCMPSLHTAWTLAMLLCAAPLAKWLRYSLLVFAGLTLLYTISGGGHYFVDMVVAIPFTVAVQYACQSRWRSPEFCANAMAVFLWLVLVRFGTELVSIPAFLYPLTLGTVALGYRCGFSSPRFVGNSPIAVPVPAPSLPS